MKKLLRVHRQPEGHWVGDGFPVHTVLDYGRHPELSPFLLLDHGGPADFAPAEKPRGVGWHPHRGFETVTVVLQGEVDHEDTAGNGGRIGPGDVPRCGGGGQAEAPGSLGKASGFNDLREDLDRPEPVHCP